MSRDSQLKDRWEELIKKLSARFSDGDPMDLDGIIYLIGIQELGQYHRTYKKEEKVNLMHIAICKLLEPYGYYEFEFFDEEGWPHYIVKGDTSAIKGRRAICINERGYSKLFCRTSFYFINRS